ncbi:MAG: PilZ domain-containing protein [Pseudomonadota bacterium]
MFGLFRRAKEADPSVSNDHFEIEDRRARGRRNIYADVITRSDGGRGLKRGIALDLSARGARIRLEHGDTLVDGMHLRIPRYGITVPAKVRWSNRQDIGVEFID